MDHIALASILAKRNLIAKTAELHHAAEKRLPPHDWQDWYAAFQFFYLHDGVTEEQAINEADNYIRLRLAELEGHRHD